MQVGYVKSRVETTGMKYIIRDAKTLSERSHPYTVVSKVIIEDKRLTPEEIGIMTFLLSNRDNFNQGIGPLQRRFNYTEERLAKIIRRLKSYGYVRREKKRGSDGKWIWETFVIEVPPALGSPGTGEPHPGNPRHGAPQHGLRGDLTSNDINKEKETKNLLMNPTEPPINKEKLKGEESTGISISKRENHTPEKPPLDYPDDLMF